MEGIVQKRTEHPKPDEAFRSRTELSEKQKDRAKSGRTVRMPTEPSEFERNHRKLDGIIRI